MNEKGFLKYCLSEVEKKIDWGDSEFWKDRDYAKLSKIISDASSISISSHTLKRLFGKIKYAKSYNPQQATKDALSIYLGFENWDDFINKQELPMEDVLEFSDSKKSKKSFRNNIVFGVILIGLIVFLLFWLRPNTHQNYEFEFQLIDSVGVVPHTVSVKYDVSKIKTDSLFLDYNFINPNRGPRINKLDKLKFVNNFTYQIPGYYPVDLMIDDVTVATKNVLVLSDGWDSYVMPENDAQRFWINNEIELPERSGSLYFSPELIQSKGLDEPVFYVANRLFKNFEIDGDNFELEVKFKNNEAIGGITCYNFNFKIFCANETNYFSLMEEGCSVYSRAKMGNKMINGVDNDLSAFKIDTNNWNVFKVIVKNKNVKAYINKVLIYEDIYETSNGNIVGIENSFKGSGMLDYVKLKDLKSGHLFLDEF